MTTATLRVVGEVGPGVRGRAGVGLDGDHLAGRPHRLGEGARRTGPTPAYRSRARSPGRGVGRRHDRRDEGRRGARVHLPEAAGGHRELVVERVAPSSLRCHRRVHALADHRDSRRSGTGDGERLADAAARRHPPPRRPARRVSVTRERVDAGAAMRQWSTGTTSCDRCRRSPARPSASTANSTRVRQSRPSASPGNGLDLDVDVEVRQPGHLLAHDVGLERPLARQGDVLEVAAAAPARPGLRARRRRPGRGTRASTSTASARTKRSPARSR